MEELGLDPQKYLPGSEYESGTVSGSYSSYNGWGSPAFNSMVTEFLVIGFYAQSRWVDTNDVVFESFDHLGIMTGSHTITLGSRSAGPYKIDLSQNAGFCGIHKFMFRSLQNQWVIIDNLEVVYF